MPVSTAWLDWESEVSKLMEGRSVNDTNQNAHTVLVGSATVLLLDTFVGEQCQERAMSSLACWFPRGSWWITAGNNVGQDRSLSSLSSYIFAKCYNNHIVPFGFSDLSL